MVQTRTYVHSSLVVVAEVREVFDKTDAFNVGKGLTYGEERRMKTAY